MIINHNISALNANRMFSNNVQRMDKNIASLSSGMRINNGSDDAAGLAVSEKMRAQVRGLNQASRNIQDGISLIQIIEGFLKETNDVLHRMRELSVQAANGTYTSEDRAQITVEMDEMVKEINRIHEDAKFNTMRLLDGKTTGLNSFGYTGMGALTDAQNPTELDETAIVAARNFNFNVAGSADQGKNGVVIQSGASTDERMFIAINEFNTYSLGLTKTPETTYASAQSTQYTSTNANQAWRERSFYDEKALDLEAAMYLEANISPSAIGTAEGNVTINLLPPQELNRVNVGTSEKSTETIAVLDIALNKVNKERATLGSFQNRMEMAMQGVDNAAENLQASESRIRDTDMAKEFVNFTKNQILSQSAASMTAQANMRSQLVMRILG
jgi:flagellin